MTFVNNRLCAVLAALALAPASLAAEPNDACAYGDPDVFAGIADSFVGDWQMHHQSGFFVASGMAMPFGEDPDGPETLTLFSMDGDLVLTHPQAQEPLVMSWADEPVWTFQSEAEADGVPQPLLSSNDLEIVMGCSNDQMARLIGQSTAVVDGVTMDFTYRLMVTDDDGMYGIMHMSAIAHGIPVNAWRSVRLFR